MASLENAVEQMYASGMPTLPDGIAIADGRRRRYGSKGYGKGGRAYYKLYPYTARDGKTYVSGYFGMWGQIDLTKIQTSYQGIAPEELQRFQRAQADIQVRERAKREAAVKFAAGRAEQQWKKARARVEADWNHPYLEKKGLQWENGLRVADDGTLYVPLVRYQVTEDQVADPAYTGPRRLAGLQKIPADGGPKLFNRGADPTGAAFRFGRKPKDGDLLLVGEGLATVLSVHQGLERAYTCYVAFTAGNLEPVARVLRTLYPKSPILFLADDDAYLEAQLNNRLRNDWDVAGFFRVDQVELALPSAKYGQVTVSANVYEDQDKIPILTAGVRQGELLRTLTFTNTGRTKAQAAARAVGVAWVAYPKFAERRLLPDPDAPRLTDFNDLHAAEGIGRVVEQIGDEIKLVRDAVGIAQALAVGAAPKAAGASGGKGRPPDEPDWTMHEHMLARFTQVYPSDTAYDAEKGRVVKIEHMRLRFGPRPVSMWLASPRKRVIDPNQIVFDPTCTTDPVTTVNLFRGMPEQPAGGSCALLLELVHYLCGEHPEDTDPPKTTWLLRWLAYPLQHLGAKMQTAIVIHGEEGTGKNLLFGTVRKMYGRHGGVITQRQLEDKFNTWQSAKLFVVANEVVTRQEMTHQAGFIRNLITEPEIQINPKFQDAREEANHMNIAFLANAMQPLLLGLNDRRCFVIRTPSPRPEAFYKAIGAEVAAGGVAAFYRHLLALDLGDFDEHSKPPMTDAKAALIELGMSTPQLFWTELKEGMLGLPYGPALSTDLYRAYCVWCARNGYKMPEGMKFFSPNFMAMNGVRRVERRVPIPGRAAELAQVGTAAEEKLRKRRVFLMGTPDSDEMAEKLRVASGVAEFRSRLHEYLREESADGGQAGHGQGSQGQAF